MSDLYDDFVKPIECYYGLANELTATDPETGQPIAFDEGDWDPDWIAAGRAYALRNDLPFPPQPSATDWVMTIQKIA